MKPNVMSLVASHAGSMARSLLDLNNLHKGQTLEASLLSIFMCTPAAIMDATIAALEQGQGTYKFKYRKRIRWVKSVYRAVWHLFDKGQDMDSFPMKAKETIRKELKQVQDAEKHFWESFGVVLCDSWFEIWMSKDVRLDLEVGYVSLEEAILIHKAMEIYLDPSFTFHIFLEMEHSAIRESIQTKWDMALKTLQCEELRPFVKIISHCH